MTNNSDCFLHIDHKDHVTNEEVCNKIQDANGKHDNLLTKYSKVSQSQMVMSHLKSFAWPRQFSRGVKNKKERKTDAEVGIQQKGLNKTRVL